MLENTFHFLALLMFRKILLSIPNLKNDGHDTGITFGDRWFKENFNSFLHSPKFPKDLLVVVTFDEGTTN